MTGRKHEAIAVEPFGMIGGVLERMTEKHRADLRAAERQPQVPAVAVVHGIHRQPPGNGGGLGENFFVERGHEKARMKDEDRRMKAKRIE